MPAETVLAARGPHLAAAHDKKVRRVAGGDEAVRVEHQCLVRSRLGRLDAGGDAVELGVRVELRILHVRGTAPHVHGEQSQTARKRLGARQLVFRNDDHGGWPDASRADPGRGALHPARDHQADVDTVVMWLARACGTAPRVSAARSMPMSRSMALAASYRRPGAGRGTRCGPVHPQSLPHAVAQDEPRVEDRHHGLSRGQSRR